MFLQSIVFIQYHCTTLDYSIGDSDTIVKGTISDSSKSTEIVSLSGLLDKAKKGYHAPDAFLTFDLSKSIIIANFK